MAGRFWRCFGEEGGMGLAERRGGVCWEPAAEETGICIRSDPGLLVLLDCTQKCIPADYSLLLFSTKFLLILFHSSSCCELLDVDISLPTHFAITPHTPCSLSVQVPTSSPLVVHSPSEDRPAPECSFLVPTDVLLLPAIFISFPSAAPANKLSLILLLRPHCTLCRFPFAFSSSYFPFIQYPRVQTEAVGPSSCCACFCLRCFEIFFSSRGIDETI